MIEKQRSHSSPNKNRRLRELDTVKYAIIHYTGSEKAMSTLDWFRSSASKVSAHFVIARNGDIHTFQSLRDVLWHAGRSQWGDDVGLNSMSVGIELCGTYDSGFTEEQYAATLRVLRTVQSLCPIEHILGHEQVSPGRKVDPGPHFNWNVLHDSLLRDGREQLCTVGPFVMPDPQNMWSTVQSPRLIEPGKEESWWEKLLRFLVNPPEGK